MGNDLRNLWNLAKIAPRAAAILFPYWLEQGVDPILPVYMTKHE